MEVNVPGILNIFRKKIINTTIDFTIDLDNQGRHAVEVYIAIDGEKEKIQNIQEIWNYGSIFKRNNKQFTISLESMEILHAMRSLNPIITDDGRMIFDVFPPVLKYLRSKKIKETEKSKTELKISDTPLKQGTNIDYDPNKGLIVETGYRQEETQKLIAPEDIKIIADGSYARIGNTFYPTSKENTKPEVKRWLDAKLEVIALDKIPEFFKRDLVFLKTKLGEVLTEKANAIEIINKPLKPKISVRKDETEWLEFKIDYISDKYELSYEMIKKQKNEYVHLDDYKWVHIDNDIIKNTEMNIRELGADRTPTGFRIPINQFFSLEEFVEQIGGIKEVTAEYQRFLEEITDFKTDEYFKLPEEIETCLTSNGIRLRPYQRAGIHWLVWLTNHYLHGILADDMGLGKTIQTIATIRLAYEKEKTPRHTLIICPKSVIHFWSREIRRCYPQARLCEYVGASRNRLLFNDSETTIFITTYETVARDSSYIHPIPFYFVVLDEATKIKNPGTQRTKVIKGINALHRIALSGTPIENRPAELWSLFDFLMKGHLGKSHKQFVNLFENPITLGNNESANTLSKRIRPFLLRRLKKDVAKDLPEKIELDEWV